MLQRIGDAAVGPRSEQAVHAMRNQLMSAAAPQLHVMLQEGFTLIELMIVVAILELPILAAGPTENLKSHEY
jgi:hypothetical protein